MSAKEKCGIASGDTIDAGFAGETPALRCKPTVGQLLKLHPTGFMRKLSENEIVRLLQRRFAGKGTSILRGIGDDAAVVRTRRSGANWVITTDMLLEEIDFRTQWITPSQLGHKALAVNLSDLAAMGAIPRFYMVALALPGNISMKWIQSFYGGMSRLARRHRAELIGGDLSRSPAGVQITITAIGEATGRRPVYRSGGRPGDILYVTGTLGKAAAGLELLLRGEAQVKGRLEKMAILAQLTPEPRCEAGVWLARSGLVRCMMDLSDGLSMDLPRLCEASGTGADIDIDQIPVFCAASAWQLNPVALALNGGEDFELLMAVPPAKAKRLEKAYPSSSGFPPLTRIGQLRPGRGVRIAARQGESAQSLPTAGFDHFRRAPGDP
jgi:thiamine-monophosphate kinase